MKPWKKLRFKPLFSASKKKRWKYASDQKSSVASFLLGGGGGETPKCTDSEKNKINNVYVFYMRERAPQNYVFSGLNIHLHTDTINAVVWRYKW